MLSELSVNLLTRKEIYTMQYNDNSKLNTLSHPYVSYEDNMILYHAEPIVFDLNTTLPIACFTELPKKLRKREITLEKLAINKNNILTLGHVYLARKQSLNDTIEPIYTAPVIVKFEIKTKNGVNYYGFEIPESINLLQLAKQYYANALIWFPTRKDV